jgi:hypothetical protein
VIVSTRKAARAGRADPGLDRGEAQRWPSV